MTFPYQCLINQKVIKINDKRHDHINTKKVIFNLIN